jgi:hypothetical protein
MKFIRDKFITDNVFICLQENERFVTFYCAKHKPFTKPVGYVERMFDIPEFKNSEFHTKDAEDESSHICFTISYKYWTGSKLDDNGKPYQNLSIKDWDFMEEDS